MAGNNKKTYRKEVKKTEPRVVPTSRRVHTYIYIQMEINQPEGFISVRKDVFPTGRIL